MSQFGYACSVFWCGKQWWRGWNVTKYKHLNITNKSAATNNFKQQQQLKATSWSHCTSWSHKQLLATINLKLQVQATSAWAATSVFLKSYMLFSVASMQSRRATMVDSQATTRFFLATMSVVASNFWCVFSNNFFSVATTTFSLAKKCFWVPTFLFW